MPYWWEAYRPVTGDLVDVPKKTRVVIVGGGYAGLSCAIELADSGIEACVLEAAELGAGASTRSGGGVSGGVNIGKSFTGKVIDRDPDGLKNILASGFDAFSLIENLIAREKIDCSWEKTGRYVGAWTPKDYQATRRTASPPERRCRFWRLHGAKGAPARGDGFRLLLRRHGRRALGQAASGTLLQGNAQRRAQAPDRHLREGCGEDHHARGSGWRIETSRGTIEAGTSSSPPTATPAMRRRSSRAG